MPGDSLFCEGDEGTEEIIVCMVHLTPSIGNI